MRSKVRKLAQRRQNSSCQRYEKGTDLNLLEPPHRHAAYPHIIDSFVWTDEGSRTGSGGREYRQATLHTTPTAAFWEIEEKLGTGGPLAPSGHLKKRPAGGPQLRKSGGPELRKSDGLQPRKLGGPQQRKSCTRRGTEPSNDRFRERKQSALVRTKFEL